MKKGTLQNLYQTKIVCLVGVASLLACCGHSFGLRLNHYLLVWVVLTLILESVIWGRLKLDKAEFVPDEKNMVSYEEMVNHFLTMRKAKFSILVASLAGMGAGFSFDVLYLVLAMGWTAYAYSVPEKKFASVVGFENKKTYSSIDRIKHKSLDSHSTGYRSYNEFDPGSVGYTIRRSRER